MNWNELGTLLEGTDELQAGEEYYYFLSGNLELSSPIEIMDGATVSICLNGYSITGSDGYNGACFSVNGGTLNLCDCSNGAGEISGFSNSSVGGGIKVSGGTFNMYGGYILDNKCTGTGGGVYLFDGTFDMHGGYIEGNESNNGAGVLMGGGVCNQLH